MRKRYLYRLGINNMNSGSVAHSDLDNITTSSRDNLEATPSSSQNMIHGLQSSPLSHYSESSKSSMALSLKSGQLREKVLLRKSVQYTTELKFDKADSTYVTTTSPTPTKTPSPTTVPKYELPSTWTNLLAIGETDVKETQVTEQLDGAFDLFSLPSDSSITSCKRATHTTVLSTDSLTEASSLNSNTITSSFSFHSMHREINEINRLTSMSLSDHSIMSSKRKVSFDSTVKATTIPTRHSYSQRVRHKLWSSSEDIVNNAMRNEFEFSFDGHDWRRVKEESDFISVSPLSEEKIHPAHFYGWPYSSRSMPTLHIDERQVPPVDRAGSNSDDDGGDMHFCGVFGMEMNTE